MARTSLSFTSGPFPVGLVRVLSLAGTVVVMIPLAAPLLLAAFMAVAGAGLHLDYLMPGELFLVVPFGGAMLLAASLLFRQLRWPVAGLLAGSAALFAATVWTADATGLATGESDTGASATVFALYGMYVGAVAALAVTGVILCTRAFAARLTA